MRLPFILTLDHELDPTIVLSDLCYLPLYDTTLYDSGGHWLLPYDLARHTYYTNGQHLIFD